MFTEILELRGFRAKCKIKSSKIDRVVDEKGEKTAWVCEQSVYLATSCQYNMCKMTYAGK